MARPAAFILPLWIACSAVLLLNGCSRLTYAPASQKQSPAQQRPDYTLSDLARRIHDQVNSVRTDRGYAPLQWSDSLAHIARLHSGDMATHGFFAHENPEGKNLTDRAEAYGLSCASKNGSRATRHLAENLFYTYPYRSYEITSDSVASRRYYWKTPSEIAAEVVQGWLESPPHRRNLLGSKLRREGLGLAQAEDDRLYVTQVFC